MSLYLFGVLICGLPFGTEARIGIASQNSQTAIINAIKAKLSGSGVTIDNIKILNAAYSGRHKYSQVGTFSNGTENAEPNIGISNGLVLTTGTVATLSSLCKPKRGSELKKSVKDPDLQRLLEESYPSYSYCTQYDPVIITFDIIPKASNLTIDFVFGSDEYEEWVGQKFVDTYGFFIKGPGIEGSFWGEEAVNVAVLSDGETPVTTNFVNQNKNRDYYIPNRTISGSCNKGNRDDDDDNSGDAPPRNHASMDGWTQVITSTLPVMPNQRYQVKIALGEGYDQKYDSSVFLGSFKSQRLFSGRLFHHKSGAVNEDLLEDGDDQTFQYFSNTRVVLFDENQNIVQETRTGPRGEYRFAVEDNRRYRVAVDASTLSNNGLLPEQTWSSRGGLCVGNDYATTSLKSAGYCYGGKTGAGDTLAQNGTLDSAEHQIQIMGGLDDSNRLNFGFSYEVVTHTGSTGQGSLRGFIDSANANIGTAQMMFAPAIPKNADQRWKITVNDQLPALTRANAIIDGRAYDLVNPEQYSSCESVTTPTLMLATSRNEPLLTLNGTGQKVCNTILTGDNALQKELIKLFDNSRNATIINNHFLDNLAPGVTVTGKAYGNRITRNRFQNLVANSVSLPIDLRGNWQIDANMGRQQSNQPNKAIDRPIIADVDTDTPGQLTIIGFAHEKSKIEFYQLTHRGYLFFAEVTEGRSSDDKDTRTGHYNDPVGGKSVKENRFKFTIPLTSSELPSQLAAIAIDTQGNTSEFSLPIGLSATITASVWHDLNENGSQEADEPRLKGINVRLSSNGGKATTSKSTDENGYVTFSSLATGNYEINVPDQSGLNGLALGATMSNPQDMTITELKTYNALFGYITAKEDAVTLTPEHQKSTAPGLFVHFPHTLTSDSGGLVTLTAQWVHDNSKTKDRTTAEWPIKLEKIPSCKIEEKRSAENSTSTLELELTAKEPECFQASFFVPAETPQGVWDSLVITATAEVEGEIKELARVIDQITVSDGGSGRLRLQKWVKTKGQNNSTTNEAGSGDILTYTIQFQNIGAGPLTDLNIMDDTPAFTVLSESVKCPDSTALPKDLGTCKLTLLGGSNSTGFRGRIIWNFDGTLQPGTDGEVSYDLIIE